jgi:hypothetical protein
MRRDSASWERAAEVREAAERWLRVGAIDRSTHEAIRTAYPDPCVTPSAVWRALTAGMVTAVIVCTLGALWIAAQPGETGLALLLLVFAGASVIATERLEASPRLARRGVAGATSFWAAVFVLAGLGLLLHDSSRIGIDRALDAVVLASVLVWGAGCWRWGNPLFAAFSAISLFLFLGRLPHGRVLWVLAGSALAGLAARRVDAPSWAPSHRRAAMVLVVTGMVAAYVAVNVYSLDQQFLEELRGLAPRRIAPAPGLFVLTAVATAALPLVILVWAWRSRRTFLLDTGVALLALSLVTLRHYVHVAPLWVMLTLSGAALLALALGLERALRRGPGGERAGFTADALVSDERRQQILQTVPVVAAFTPAAPAAVAEDEGFAGRGGRFGGGGASEKF